MTTAAVTKRSQRPSSSRRLSPDSVYLQTESSASGKCPTSPSAGPLEVTQHTVSFWDDGSNDTYADPNKYSFVASHAYTNDGQYMINVYAMNLVSVMTCMNDNNVTAVMRIRNLTLSGNDSLLWSPGFGTWRVDLGLDQPQLKDLVCNWTIAKTTFTRMVALLTAETTHEVNFTFARNDCGVQTVFVNCSNLISWKAMSMNVQVILDNVTLGALVTHPSSTEILYWNSTLMLTLYIVRFGSGACVFWNMGDGTPGLLFLGPSRACNESQFLGYHRLVEMWLSFNMTAPYDSINFTYKYAQIGNYTITVRAFNHINYDIVRAKVTVSDWPCVKPNVTLDPIFTNPAAPFTTLVPRGFNISCNITVDCSKSEGYTTSWELFTAEKLASSSPGIPLRVVRDTETFVSPPFVVRDGRYTMRLTVAMFSSFHNMTGYVKVVYAYITVDQSPLMAGIANGPNLTVPFNSTVMLDAFNATFDPDMSDPRNKTGFVWTWLCKRSSEAWPLNPQPVSYRRFDPSTSARGGCFGDGPGILPFTAPWVQLDTGYFEGNVKYTFQLRAKKDKRNASAEMELFVSLAMPPVLEIICESNCQSRVFVKDQLIMRSVCYDYCDDWGGSLTVWWELYVGGTNPMGPYILLSNLASLTSNGLTNSSSLFIKSLTFEQGQYYWLVVNGRTPNSYNRSTVYSFQANISPYGGTCSVSPTNGTAGETFFNIACSGWKYMYGSTVDMKYGYVITPRNTNGSVQEQIIYHGSEQFTGPVLLPVGNCLDSYYNEITPVIYDALNDSVEGDKIEVQVFLPTIPLPDFVEQLSNPSALDFLLTKLPTITTANILAVLSVLNAPDCRRDPTGASDFLDGDMSSSQDVIGPVNAANVGAYAPGPDPDPEQQLREAQLREKLLSGLVSVRIESAPAITQRSSAVQALTKKPELVSPAGVEMAGAIMDSMLTTFIQLRMNQTREKQIKGSQDIAAVVLSMGIASNTFITTASSSPSSNISSIFPASPLQSSAAASGLNGSAARGEAARQQVASVMRRAVKALNSMVQFFEANQALGDSPVIIKVPKQMYIQVQKTVATYLANTTISNSLGEIHINSLESTASCLQQKTLQSVTNLFLWNSSASAVNSPIASMILKTCASPLSSTQSGQKGSSDLSAPPSSATPSSAALEVKISTPLKHGTYINETTGDIYGMLIHVYNLTTPGPIPVLLSVTPIRGRNDTLIVYVKGDRRPTPEDYDWILMTYNGTCNYSLYLDERQMGNASVMYVGVQSSDGCRMTKSCKKRVELHLDYYIYFQEVTCHFWVEDEEMWITGPCQVKSVSPRKVAFRSNLLGGFGGGFVTPVNTIDFNNLFNDFGQKLIDNACVWATLVAIIVLYVPFAVLARRLDQRDLLKWDILPLLDNYDEDEFDYEIHVHSGFARKAGTKSQVFFRIYGSEAETGVRRMTDGIRQNFGRGEVSTFAMKTPYCLGVPLKFEVWHDNSGGKNAAWYLGKIVLVDVKTGNWYMFICDNWLAVDRDDGHIRRTLTVSHSFVTAEGAVLVRKNLSQGIFEDHLWLSVGYRAKKSLFTRAQRLGACMATLFLAMITNCMFYKDANDQESSPQVIHIGPISITGNQLYNSIVSSLIVFPLILTITVIFSKARHKFTGSKFSTKPVNSRTSLGAGTLPHWCTYFAWALVFVSIAVSGVFTVFYSLDWGKKKSEDWLVAFLLSFAESAILIQPVKVLIVALMASFILKQDPEVSVYEKQLGKMKSISYADQVKIHLVGGDKAVENLASSVEIAAARRKKEIDDKMKAMIREIIFYVAFLFLILLVVNGQQNNWSFRQNRNLVSALTGSVLNNVTYVKQGLWFWTRDTLLPVLFASERYNGKPVTAYDKNYMSDMNSWRIGPPRLRQLRVRKELCVYMARSVRGYRCTNSYSSSLEDTSAYKPSWVPVRNLSYVVTHENELTELQKAFIYRTEDELSGQSFDGVLSSYPGGGYVASLGLTLEVATKMIEELQRTRWIDFYTRAVFVEFNIFNPGSSLGNLATVLVEFPTTGDMLWSSRTEIIQLYRYSGANGVVALVSEIACAIFVLIITILELIKVCRERMNYFRPFWNCSQLLTLVLFHVAVILYTLRCIWTIRVVEDMMNNPGKPVSFSPIIRYNNHYLILMGIVAFLTQCRLLHLLRYNQTISVLGHTLAKSAMTLLSFAVFAGVIFIAFTIGAYLLFFQIKDYSSMYDCTQSLVAAFLGKFNFGELVAYYGRGAGYYLLIYLITMIIFIMNVLISIINEYLAAVSDDPASHPKDHEVVSHFFETIKAVVIGDRKQKGGGKNVEGVNHLQALSNRIGYLGDVAETMMQSSWTLEKTDSLLLFTLLYQKEKRKKRLPKIKP